MNRQEKLEWLARNVHEWDDSYLYVEIHFSTPMNPSRFGFTNHPNYSGLLFTKQEWLSMREKLQNKPKFADHPDAKCFVQNNDGQWFKSDTDSEIYPIDDSVFWRMTGDGYWTAINEGIVLGDWRDTLEKRPESATKTGQNEMTITTQDNSWHERGELPPVGTVCELVCLSGDVIVVEIVKSKNGKVYGWCDDDDAFYECESRKRLRPLRTEREKAIDEMVHEFIVHYGDPKGGERYLGIAKKLYDAGYRKQ